MKTFVDTVKAYSSWKFQESGNAKVSKKEILALREEYKRDLKSLREKNTTKKPTKQLREAIENFRKWKISNKKGSTIEKIELQKIKEALIEKNKKDFSVYVSNYKKFKEAANQGNKLLEKEIRMLKENFRESIKNGIKLEEALENFDVKKALREADMGMDPAAAAGAPMPGDPNAMGVDPMAAGGMPPADPMAMQGAIDQAVAALQPFSQAGDNPLDANAAAGVPPVDGTTVPGAGAPAPATPGLMEATKAFIAWKKANNKGETLTESEKKILQEKYGEKQKSEYDKIKERIAAREAKILALQEGAVQDAQKKTDSGKGYPEPVSNSHGGDHSVSEEQVVVPAASKLSNGYSSGAASKETAPAKTWPTKAMGKEAGGALQGSGASQTKIKEEEESSELPENQEQLEENLTVTDIYISDYLSPKLDFAKIRESMVNGLLG
jgi:hypothetical protein